MASVRDHLDSAAVDSRPTVADLQGDNPYTQAARKHWLDKAGQVKVRPEVLKSELWDVLDAEGFPFRSLLVLESLQILESYLWPGYTEDSSNYHVLLIVLIVNVKKRENLPIWDSFSLKPADFSSLFRRILSMNLDLSLLVHLRTHLLSFVISAFQSLDNGLVRKECAPLVSIAIWHNLHNDKVRSQRLDRHELLKKAWRASRKRYDTADDTVKARLRFERAWLCSMIVNFFDHLYGASDHHRDDILYCERFLEFLTDLESQLPTRRYVNTLVGDLNLISVVRRSPMFDEEGNALLRDMHSLLYHFVSFPMDDYTGRQQSRSESIEDHFKSLARLQRIGLKRFNSKLTIMALANYASIDKRDDLDGHLSSLTDAELTELCKLLDFRTAYPTSSKVRVDRAFLKEVLLSAHERRQTFQESVQSLSVRPTESTLFEPTLLRNESYSGSRPLAIPKLNLQYLTIGDFLWRSFILQRCETFFEIRKDIATAVRKVQPRLNPARGGTTFDGFSKMALPVPKPAMLEVFPPKVGQTRPAAVRAELSLDLGRLSEAVRREWDALRPDDVIFLLSVESPGDTSRTSNGHVPLLSPTDLGLKHLRLAEVVRLCDHEGRQLRHFREEGEVNGQGYGPRSTIRKLQVNLDTAAYQSDTERTANGKPDVYQTINLIVRRRSRENNFKPVLESMRSLALSNVPAPSWLEEVFLGFGDPSSATYTRLPNRLKTVDFRDTFLDWEHLVESFPGRIVRPATDDRPVIDPPYVLNVSAAEAPTQSTKVSGKRRRDGTEPAASSQTTVTVSTYQPPNLGPYATDAPRKNLVRFTPAQTEAIVSGTQPGLTVIVGPPGTGKTDVATQIINNLYHNFPEQRTLLVAHSNQALNQLFRKIIALDIDERHLLRLGHGEEELDTEASYSKHGRVESFLENRERFLADVDRLAVNFKAPGAHGNSCETAGYFDSVYVKPAWAKFKDVLEAPHPTAAAIAEAFPFHTYFSNAPQPLFPPEASSSVASEIANGCYRHIRKIFAELDDIRPFEILRTGRDKANYLLIKEARIIAMTSTHAAMRRQEIADLGFHYDNIVMEEAAQITEIETFIPMALQKPKDGRLPLQRVVLCGDHLQNSPIVQNLAFRQYANLEQSLFLRLIRLGVPSIKLDQQGRARPSIADLYRWRYTALADLPTIRNDPAFQRANAGFRYEYQFVNVDDYKGAGEVEPTPHFIQNLGEAEYAVAIYQYMRLLGYPARSISILAMYAGQRALIKDVLGHRCAKNALFGLPKTVTTVDRYQGEQNDYVILSLTRTSRIGYLRDIRRLTVALSRARLGLYILGRREVFASCHELKGAFDHLFTRSDRLQLSTGEVFPTARSIGDEVDATEMEGVEHLGQYVYEMTQARMAALSGANGEADNTRAGHVSPMAEEGPADDDVDGADDAEEGDAVDE